jgi:putative FmdB family regulatory protein
VPLYEYQCKQCQHRFEKIQSFSAPEEKVCPECGGEVERLISAPAIQFKGAGWYVNDYAGRGKAPSASASDSGSKEGSSKEGSKDAASKSEGAKADSGSKSGTGAAPSSNSGSSATGSTSGPSKKSSD